MRKRGSKSLQYLVDCCDFLTSLQASCLYSPVPPNLHETPCGDVTPWDSRERFKPHRLLPYALLSYELFELREGTVSNNSPPSGKLCWSQKSPHGYHEEETTRAWAWHTLIALPSSASCTWNTKRHNPGDAREEATPKQPFFTTVQLRSHPSHPNCKRQLSPRNGGRSKVPSPWGRTTWAAEPRWPWAEWNADHSRGATLLRSQCMENKGMLEHKQVPSSMTTCKRKWVGYVHTGSGGTRE